MTLRELLLAFLAARYPSAYNAAALALRINAAALLDTSVTEASVSDELRILSNKFDWVTGEINQINGAIAWSATTDGVKQWHLSGQLYVG